MHVEAAPHPGRRGRPRRGARRASRARRSRRAARVSEIIVYGTDPCPRSTDDEVVVCARKPESERYRIPERFAQRGSRQSRQAWARNAKSFETVGATGINSCSPVGPAGYTGCLQQIINQAAAKRARQIAGERAARPPEAALKLGARSRRDPRVDLRFERVERHRALPEHRVVEAAEVELVAQLLFRRARSSRIFSSPIL